MPPPPGCHRNPGKRLLRIARPQPRLASPAVSTRRSQAPLGISLPPAAWFALLFAGLLLTGMVVLLTFQLGELRTSRERIDSLDAKAESLANQATPLLEGAQPLVQQAGGLADRLARSSDDLRAALRLAPVLDRAARVVTDEASPVLRQLTQVDLVATLGAIRIIATDLISGDRLNRLIDDTQAMLAAVERRGLLGDAERAAVSTIRLERLQRRLLSLQRRSLAVQKDSRRVQRRSRVIQRETLKHVRSLDRKTGGTFPPPP